MNEATRHVIVQKLRDIHQFAKDSGADRDVLDLLSIIAATFLTSSEWAVVHVLVAEMRKSVAYCPERN